MTFEPLAKGEKKFAAVQKTEFTKDPSGNGPEVFSASKTKEVDRKGTRLGKGPKQDMNKTQVAAESTVIDEGNAENKFKKNLHTVKTGMKKDIVDSANRIAFSKGDNNSEKRTNAVKAWKRIGRNNQKPDFVTKEEDTTMAEVAAESEVQEITNREWEDSKEDKRVDKKAGYVDGTKKDKEADKKMVDSINKAEKHVMKEDHSDILEFILDVKPLEFEKAYFVKLQERVTILSEAFEQVIGKELFGEGVDVVELKPEVEDVNESFDIDESLDLTEANNVNTLRVKHQHHYRLASQFSNESVEMLRKAHQYGRTTDIGKHFDTVANELGKRADSHNKAASTAKEMLTKAGIPMYEEVVDEGKVNQYPDGTSDPENKEKFKVKKRNADGTAEYEKEKNK
ncbi:MAG: hypothetical protein P4L79_11085 [Legionella sp.]|uniref:hypothetical protein n=1 Tax=Legionella sp. TaxID=459 RepID=UPI00283DE810|nr:hypothetical protein [Legionella sp.]